VAGWRASAVAPRPGSTRAAGGVLPSAMMVLLAAGAMLGSRRVAKKDGLFSTGRVGFGAAITAFSTGPAGDAIGEAAAVTSTPLVAAASAMMSSIDGA